MSAQRKPTDPSQHAEDCTESQVAEALCAAAAEVAPASADLPIDGQAVQGGGWGYPQSTVVLNHNETLSAEDGDNDAQPEAVADLAPAQTEQDALKGGPFGGFKLNHNGTLAADASGESSADC